MPAVPRGRRAGEPFWLGVWANTARLGDLSCINATMDELHVGNTMPKINVLFIIIAFAFTKSQEEPLSTILSLKIRIHVTQISVFHPSCFLMKARNWQK